ncbi:MAG: glycosyltransferase family 2 protein [Candidatus Neomarinimicrobiota bacterium]|nr:glycosyltransferase family 2 protein [Candidatus Neomarinimicrobiota bacterium]
MVDNSSLSIVIPVFNERESIPLLLDEIHSAVSGYEYEIVCIDDGSSDGTSEYLQERSRDDRRLRLIQFLRNYGKSAALAEGFKHASSDFVVTLDSDLQDDPNEIPRLVKKLEEGFDLVSGWKKERHDPLSKRLPSKFFNFVTRLLTGIRIHDFNCGLKGYRRRVVKLLDLYGGMHRYIPVIAGKKGFSVTELVVNHRPRQFGESKFGKERYFRGLFDLLTVLFLNRYTRQPLHLFGLFGLISLFIGIGVEVRVLYLKYGLSEPFSNHIALLVFGVMLVILGVQFISIGLLGEMIAQATYRTQETAREVVLYDSSSS